MKDLLAEYKNIFERQLQDIIAEYKCDIQPISDALVYAVSNGGKRIRGEKIGKEKANKTARVKWGRGKREANGK